jgi:hypothetical protein
MTRDRDRLTVCALVLRILAIKRRQERVPTASHFSLDTRTDHRYGRAIGDMPGDNADHVACS